MTSDVGYCEPHQDLATAAAIMWHRDCGFVPVVDHEKRVVGVVTDRDVCIAVATQNRLASEIKINEIIGTDLTACRVDDNVEKALKIMRKRQLRRLPVTNENGSLAGVVSVADFLRHAGKGKKEIAPKKVFAALKKISELHPIQLRELSSSEVERELNKIVDEDGETQAVQIADDDED